MTTTASKNTRRRPSFQSGRILARQSGDGFTLIETIIAMSLVGLLMAAIWSMFSIYTRLEQKGVAAAQKVAVLRALHGQMREDLIRITPCSPDRVAEVIDSQPVSNTSSDTFAENGFFIGSESEIHFMILDPSVASNVAALRVVSYQPDSNQREPNRADESGEGSPGPGKPPAETLQVVQIPSGMERRTRGFPEFARQNAIRDEMEEVAMGGREMELDADDFLVIGGEALEQQQAMQVTVLPEQVDRIAEVSRYRFRFFDGVQWQATWDSALTGKLPVAVEFQMDLDVVDREAWDEQSINVALQDQATVVDGGRINSGKNRSTGLEASNPNSSTSITGVGDSFAGESIRDGVSSAARSPESLQSTTRQRFDPSGQSLDSVEDRLEHRWLITIDSKPPSNLANEDRAGFGASVWSEGSLP